MSAHPRSDAGAVLSKRGLRAAVRARRAGLDPAWVASAGLEAQERLLTLAGFRSAARVALYLALPVEVPTAALLAACRRAGKEVAVPVPAAASAGGGYVFCRLDEGAALVPGPLRVLQPERIEELRGAAPDLVVVPGVAFDRDGGRVGHGAGYYDGLLARFAPAAFKVGLAFEFQVFDRVPVEAHDVRVDAVVTERSVYVGSPAGRPEGSSER